MRVSHGYAEKGGGFYVGENADLKINACEITHCTADQWGGGVDVNGGHLSVRSSLFSITQLNKLKVREAVLYPLTQTTILKSSIQHFPGIFNLPLMV